MNINAQTIIAEVLTAQAIAPDECTPNAFVKFQTSARGSHRILNCKENLQRFADLVRKNAAAFGGGLIREEKARPSVIYASKTISLYKQLIEDKDWYAALQLADEKLNPLFYFGNDGKAHIQVAQIPLEADSRLVSVLNEDGTWSVIDPVSMMAMHGHASKNKRSRDAQIENAMQRYSKGTQEAKENMFAKAYAKPVDQSATRAKWLADHGIVDDAAIEARIEANAAQDVAQIVAQAVAVSAIVEAMAPSEESTPELVTCESGESEANTASMGNASGFTVTAYNTVTSMLAGFTPTAPPSDGNAGDTTTPMESTPDLEYDVYGMFTSFAPNTPAGVAAWKELARENNGTGKVLNEHAESTIAQLRDAGYTVAKSGKCAVDDDALLSELAAPAPTPAVSTESPAPRPMESTNFAADIPLSLAVSAFGGVSMSPERRGASAQAGYAQDMAQDYETMRIQAVKGGTLDLLPEVFARYRGRQAGAYRAYLASSSRCVSSFIAGPSNFPAARMNKRNDIAHRRLTEYLDGGKMAMQAAIRTLRPDLRAIMAGDADAIDRLAVKIANAERSQERMKEANKAIRTHAKSGHAHQVEALMALGFTETQSIELIKPDFCGRIGFANYQLTNNNANIRRMKDRLEQISKAQATEVQSVECVNGVTLEDDAPSNRVRLYFPGKPDEAIRTELKANGFRWAPSIGAWQAYRNRHTLTTAKRLAGEPAPAEDVPEVAEVAPIEAMAPVVESVEVSAPPVAEVETEHLPDAPTTQAAEIQPEPVAPVVEIEAQQVTTEPAATPDDTQKFRVRAKSGEWRASFMMIGTMYALLFNGDGSKVTTTTYATHQERMQALEAMARATTPPDTPPDGGLPIATVDAPTGAPTPPVAQCTPDTPVAVSRAKPEHDLQVGDVVRSSWGYDQTNVNHYQIIALIGKRTVEVRELAEHKESTGDMTGRVAPVWGEFIGEAMRRTVDRHGNVNILREKFGRARKIEPVAVVHGVRCYASTGYSSYA